MPTYIFQHPITREYREVIQNINSKHIYIDEYGIHWERIFTSPQLNTEGSLSANATEKEFSEYTKNKKGTIGDLWDRSRELSDKRKKIYGRDPVKEKYNKTWSEKRKGKKRRDI
jgi:hypothetical protein